MGYLRRDLRLVVRRPPPLNTSAATPSKINVRPPPSLLRPGSGSGSGVADLRLRHSFNFP
jgi:hypothetical protein